MSPGVTDETDEPRRCLRRRSCGQPEPGPRTAWASREPGAPGLRASCGPVHAWDRGTVSRRHSRSGLVAALCAKRRHWMWEGAGPAGSGQKPDSVLSAPSPPSHSSVNSSGNQRGRTSGAGGPLRPLWLGTGSQSTPSPEEFLAEFPTRLVAVFILRNEASPCARTYRCRQDRQVEDGAEAGLPGRTGQTATQLCPCAGPLPRVRVAASVTRVAVYPSFSASLYLGIDHVCSCTCLSPWPAV